MCCVAVLYRLLSIWNYYPSRAIILLSKLPYKKLMKGINRMKLSNEEKQAILDSCEDESLKVIRYLQEQETKQKPYNLAMLIFTIISATGAVIAAVTGILMYFQ